MVYLIVFTALSYKLYCWPFCRLELYHSMFHFLTFDDLPWPLTLTSTNVKCTNSFNQLCIKWFYPQKNIVFVVFESCDWPHCHVWLLLPLTGSAAKPQLFCKGIKTFTIMKTLFHIPLHFTLLIFWYMYNFPC